ncbi:hypothetical protein [Streptomyces sp. NPDC058371]|uniref:hypothetical protein n=1 Tax=Streptomyces sp. NPDC058371 TaxID=3346463 RepID=UPI00365C0C11
MSCTWKVYDCVGEGLKWGLGETGEALANGAVETFAKAIGEAASQVLKALNGVWMNVEANDAETPMNRIVNELNWLVGYVAVASLLFAAIRMAVDRKGQSMRQAFNGMWKVLLVGGIGVAVVTKLTAASDAYAQEVYAKSDLGETADTILGVMTLQYPGLVLIFGLLVMLSSFVQICLMYIRIGVLITLVGTLPLAAVSSMTGWGEGWWKKHIGWLTAWLLYKPAAALIIYAATTMTRSTKGDGVNGSADLNTTIAGMGMLILSVFALPALLKLIVPATAALGSTSGGTVTLNAVNNMASGAVSIAAGGAGGGGSSAGPQGSPSSGAGTSAGGSAGGAGGGAGAGGAGAAGGAAAAGAATGGAALAVQAAAVAVQTGVAAASEVAHSLDDNDGMKGHNQ